MNPHDPYMTIANSLAEQLPEKTLSVSHVEKNLTLMLGQKSGMSQSAATAVFNAAYGREGENFEARTFQAAVDSIHDRTVPISEAKQRMMDALAKLSPEETRVLHRELQRALAQHVATMPRNRAERRRAAKGRRRA